MPCNESVDINGYIPSKQVVVPTPGNIPTTAPASNPASIKNPSSKNSIFNPNWRCVQGIIFSKHC